MTLSLRVFILSHSDLGAQRHNYNPKTKCKHIMFMSQMSSWTCFWGRSVYKYRLLCFCGSVPDNNGLLPPAVSRSQLLRQASSALIRTLVSLSICHLHLLIAPFRDSWVVKPTRRDFSATVSWWRAGVKACFPPGDGEHASTIIPSSHRINKKMLCGAAGEHWRA